MKKPTRKSLTRKLDKACSDIIRSIGKCAYCGNEDYSKLQAAHVFSRSIRSVRWELNNIVCLCAKCHFWVHAHPILWAEFVRDYLGSYKYQNLKLQANMIKKWSIKELEDLLKALEKA